MAIRVSVNENEFIEVVVEDFAEFVQTWAPYLSADGIFVPTHQILLTGEHYALEVQLLDGFPLIQARGEIAWTRDSSSADRGPSGAALRLREVDAAGRDLIARIEDRYAVSGGQRFDIDSPLRKQAERVLIPEPDAELLKEATLGSLRASATERRDGVMAIDTGEGSPNFAPGMGSANDMRGKTMAPIQSGVWRALRVGDLRDERAGASEEEGNRGLDIEPAQAALRALTRLEEAGSAQPSPGSAQRGPRAPAHPEPGATGSSPGRAGAGVAATGGPDVSRGAGALGPQESTGAADAWTEGLSADDWDFYEDDPTPRSPSSAPAGPAPTPTRTRAGPSTGASDRGPSPPTVHGSRPPVRPATTAAAAPSPPAAGTRAAASESGSPVPGRSPARSSPSPVRPASPTPPSGAPQPAVGAGRADEAARRPGNAAPGPTTPDEAAVRTSQSRTPQNATPPYRIPQNPAPRNRDPRPTPPGDPRPLNDVAALRDAAPTHDSDSPPWSEPLEAPPAAPKKHAFFEVDDLFRIDDDTDLEAEVRESAMRVSRTINALSMPKAREEPTAESEPGGRAGAEPGPAEAAASAPEAAAKKPAEDQAGAVVFERDLELALADLNAPRTATAEEDGGAADVVVFESDLEQAMSELTGSHSRISLTGESEPSTSSRAGADPPVHPARPSPADESAADLFAPTPAEQSAIAERPSAPQVASRTRDAEQTGAEPVTRAPVVGQPPPGATRESAPPSAPERRSSPSAPVARPDRASPAAPDPRPDRPSPAATGPRTGPSSPAAPTPFEPPARAYEPRPWRPKPPTDPTATTAERPRTPSGGAGSSSRPSSMTGDRPSGGDRSRGGLSSIDEALTDPIVPLARSRPTPRAAPRASVADQAFENLSSEFLRSSLAGPDDPVAGPGRDAADEGDRATAVEPAVDPMRELAESMGGGWAPWANEPKRPKLDWSRLARLSGALRVAGILVLAPLFVALYLGVQQCYGDTVYDSLDTPALGPPKRMALTDSRVILETPGKSLWDLVQEEGLPEVELLVTTPVGQAARRLIEFDAEAVEGGTVVTLVGDGTFGPVSTVHLRLDRDPPREVLKISGIVDPPEVSELEVATAEVARLRFGYHLRRHYNELQVVADLTGPEVRLVEITVERRRLVLRFER